VANVVPDTLSRYPLGWQKEHGPVWDKQHPAEVVASLQGEVGEGKDCMHVDELTSLHPEDEEAGTPHFISARSLTQIQAEAAMGVEAVASLLFDARTTDTILDAVREQQLQDTTFCAELLAYIDRDEQPADTARAASLRKRSLLYTVREGLLYRRATVEVDTDDDGHGQLRPAAGVAHQAMSRLVIPPSMRDEIIHLFHDNPRMGSHMGVKPMMAKLALRYYWPGMRNQVTEYCKQCWTCGTGKTYRAHARRQDEGRYIPYVPFERIAMDICFLPKSKRGNKYALVIMDMLSNWVEVIPIPDKRSDTVIRVFLQEWVRRYGCPRVVVSDRGSEFVAKCMRRVCKKLATEQLFCASYRPAANGKVERFNGIWKELLKPYIGTTQTDWDDHLPNALMAYCMAHQEGLGASPFAVLFGLEPRLPIDLVLPAAMVGAIGADDMAYQQAVKAWRDQHGNRHQGVHDRLLLRQQARVANKKRREGPVHKLVQDAYAQGACVLLRRVLPQDVKVKLAHKYDGPLWVHQVVSPGERDVYGLIDGKPYAERAVAVERLKPAPNPMGGAADLKHRYKVVKGKTFQQVQADAAAADSSTDVHMSTEQSEAEFNVECIASHKRIRHRTGLYELKYEVKWRGYSDEHNTWYFARDLPDCIRKIEEYHRENSLDRDGNPNEGGPKAPVKRVPPAKAAPRRRKAVEGAGNDLPTTASKRVRRTPPRKRASNPVAALSSWSTNPTYNATFEELITNPSSAWED
jgi:transposase InsO family protein